MERLENQFQDKLKENTQAFQKITQSEPVLVVCF